MEKEVVINNSLICAVLIHSNTNCYFVHGFWVCNKFTDFRNLIINIKIIWYDNYSY
jgi:hypothetical protein